MERITKAATVTVATDQGHFTAIMAAYTLDRGGDRIIPGAFAKTVAQWRASGKRIPLHWDHKSDPQYIIGSLDPASMEEVSDVGLKVSGDVDLENSDVAREAWRAMKTGSMSLSFGYLVPEGMARKAADGAIELHEIDLFEGTIAPAPMNGDTRILSMKSAEADQLNTELQDVKDRLDKLEKALEDQRTPVEGADKEPVARSVDPLRQQAEQAELDVKSGGLDRLPKRQEAAPEAAPDLMDLAVLKQRSRDLMLQVLTGTELAE